MCCGPGEKKERKKDSQLVWVDLHIKFTVSVSARGGGEELTI